MRRIGRFLLFVFLSVILALSTVVPAWADIGWIPPGFITPPSQYSGRVYARTQWMRFYINYGGYNLGRTGQYAVPVGGYYALAFGIPGDPNSGWSAVEKSPKLPPASGTPISSEVEGWLEGFLGLNPQLNDPDYWLCSPAFLTGQQIPLPGGLFTSGAWPISTNPEGSNQKLDVPIYVGTRLPDGSAPPVKPSQDTTHPLCIKNGPDNFAAGATDGYKTRYVWSGFASSEPAGGQPPLGNVNLTQETASSFVKWVFNHPLGYTGYNLSSGYVTASFPYNVLVLDVTKADDDGANAYYDWSVANPTPLWLHNITVRVYTHGKQTGKWNLVAVYQNVDIPPASLDEKVKGTPNNKDIKVSASGAFAVAHPRLPTKVPKPSEPYDVVVTANVDLSVQNGQIGTPYYDQGLKATYWTGNNFVPGLPSNEVPGTQLFDRSQSVLGRTLPNPFGDNVASTSDSGYQPPGGGGEPNNLVAKNVTCDANTGQTEAAFSNMFKMGGTVTVRFYFQPEGGDISLVDQKIMWVAAESDFTASAYIPDADSKSGTVFATVDYRLSGSVWIPEKYRGDDGKECDEATYDDNKASCSVGHEPYQIQEPGDHPASYHPMRNVPKYELVTEPVYGWKKVEFVKEGPQGKVRVRLVD